MMAAVSAMAADVGERSFGQWCGKVRDATDCAIPIVITAILGVGWESVIFGFVD